MDTPGVQPERGGDVGESVAGPGVAAAAVGGSLVVSRPKSIRVAVREELDRIGKADSPMGAAALKLAARLDVGEDPGSAMAAMAKELRVTMAELGRSAPAVSDPVDELKRRRERRLGAG